MTDGIVLHVDRNGKPYAKPMTPRQWCARNGYSLRELQERLDDLVRLGVVTAQLNADGSVSYSAALEAIDP